MLETPLGTLNVYINNEQVAYDFTELSLRPIEICDYEVEGRYKIEIDKSMLKSGDIVTFCINTDIISEIDGGDSLIEAMFESDELYLALGGYEYKNNTNYKLSVIENGLKAEITKLEYLDDFSVAIAWSSTDKNDYYTAVWFAADPYI